MAVPAVALLVAVGAVLATDATDRAPGGGVDDATVRTPDPADVDAAADQGAVGADRDSDPAAPSGPVCVEVDDCLRWVRSVDEPDAASELPPWRTDTVIAGDLVVSALDDRIVAVGLGDGEVRWEDDVLDPMPLAAPLPVVDGLLLHLDGPLLVARDVRYGTTRWQVDAGDRHVGVTAAPLGDHVGVVLWQASQDDPDGAGGVTAPGRPEDGAVRIAAIGADGQVAWSQEAEAGILGDDAAYVGDGSELRALDADGRTRWTTETDQLPRWVMSGLLITDPPAAEPGSQAAGQPGQTFRAAATGQQLDVEGSPTPLGRPEDELALFVQPGVSWTLAEGGEVVWTRQTDGQQPCGIELVDDVLAVDDCDGTRRGFALDDGAEVDPPPGDPVDPFARGGPWLVERDDEGAVVQDSPGGVPRTLLRTPSGTAAVPEATRGLSPVPPSGPPEQMVLRGPGFVAALDLDRILDDSG